MAIYTLVLGAGRARLERATGGCRVLTGSLGGVNHPGALVQPYAVLLMARGGRLLTGDASSLIRR